MPHVVVVEDQHEARVVQVPRLGCCSCGGFQLLGEEVDGPAAHDEHQEEVEDSDHSESLRSVPVGAT